MARVGGSRAGGKRQIIRWIGFSFRRKREVGQVLRGPVDRLSGGFVAFLFGRIPGPCEARQDRQCFPEAAVAQPPGHLPECIGSLHANPRLIRLQHPQEGTHCRLPDLSQGPDHCLIEIPMDVQGPAKRFHGTWVPKGSQGRGRRSPNTRMVISQGGAKIEHRPAVPDSCERLRRGFTHTPVWIPQAVGEIPENRGVPNFAQTFRRVRPHRPIRMSF